MLIGFTPRRVGSGRTRLVKFACQRKPGLTSRAEPFRRTQTRINGRLKEYNPTEGEEHNWEDAMDKNFENITLLVRKKKDAKEENIFVNF